jgi:hypothetical protein
VKLIAGVLIAAGMLMLFGCGGSSTDSSLTRAEFTSKMNRMCKQEKQERTQAEEAKKREVGLQPGKLASPSQQAQIVEASVPFYEKVTEQMKELAPSDQADAIESVVQMREKAAEIVRQGGPSTPALRAIYKANKSALQYGLDECSI